MLHQLSPDKDCYVYAIPGGFLDTCLLMMEKSIISPLVVWGNHQENTTHPSTDRTVFDYACKLGE
jgi:hypothetical protein